MCWNAEDVQPFAFGNTVEVKKDHPVNHLVDWTEVVARGAPGGRLQALVINCHGWYSQDYTGTLDSSGGIPRISGGFGLNIGKGGITLKNANVFSGLAGLVGEIHIYACAAASTPIPAGEIVSASMCQTIADASQGTVVASLESQPDMTGPGLNMAPPMIGKVVRFTPSKK
jgi:hypothetical protein